MGASFFALASFGDIHWLGETRAQKRGGQSRPPLQGMTGSAARELAALSEEAEGKLLFYRGIYTANAEGKVTFPDF